MESSQIKIVGVGGLGCSWAINSHNLCRELAEIFLIDANESLAGSYRQDEICILGHGNDGSGNACLPPLAEQRMRSMDRDMFEKFADVELVIVLAALGGGTGSGAAPEIARQAKSTGATVLSIACMPFEFQTSRLSLAKESFEKLQKNSDVCIELSSERLAKQENIRGNTWTHKAEWIESLVNGIVRTLMDMGLINLDLMDLKTIVCKEGMSTMLVGIGDNQTPREILESATRAPLAEFDVKGAKGCLLQIEGGTDMTISQVDELANLFTKKLDDDAQVILGARVSPDLAGQLRVVCVLSGIHA